MAKFYVEEISSPEYHLAVTMNSKEAYDLLDKLGKIHDQYKPTHIVGDMYRSLQALLNGEEYSDHR